MQAGVESSDHGRVVQRCRGGDADHVQLTASDQVAPVGEQPVSGDAVPVAELGQLVRLLAGKGDQIDTVQLGIRRHVLLAGPAQTDHACAHGAAHS